MPHVTKINSSFALREIVDRTAMGMKPEMAVRGWSHREQIHRDVVRLRIDGGDALQLVAGQPMTSG